MTLDEINLALQELCINHVLIESKHNTYATDDDQPYETLELKVVFCDGPLAGVHLIHEITEDDVDEE